MSISRSKAVKVGTIKCPICQESALIKKSSMRSGKLFIACENGCGATNNLSKNYQHHINRVGVFDDELPVDTVTVDVVTVPVPVPVKVEPVAEKKKSMFSSIFSE
jgi:uncharacterized C2H2 Zn-finger protein